MLADSWQINYSLPMACKMFLANFDFLIILKIALRHTADYIKSRYCLAEISFKLKAVEKLQAIKFLFIFVLLLVVAMDCNVSFEFAYFFIPIYNGKRVLVI